MISYSETIKIPLGIVWENFIYKIDNPENFVSGVNNVIIKEKNAEFTLRQMDIVSPDGLGHQIVEKITFSPTWVKFLIIEHPIYSGYVSNLAEKITEYETKITFSINWKNKVTGELFSNHDIVKNAVLKTVDFISKSHK